MKKKILVIGCGNFGKLISEFFKKDLEVFVFDKKDFRVERGVKKLKDMNMISEMDYIVFAVPVQFLEDSVKEFKKYISEKSIIFDVASVKVFPLKILKKHFKKNEILGTHPLWGPESIKQKFKNLIVVLSNVSAKPKTVREVSNYIKKFDFKIIKMTAEEHDKEMAIVQGLSHFIGFSLRNFHLTDSNKLKTFAYREMMRLYHNTENDSEELFKTIQNYNPYAKKIREKYIKEVLKINENLK